jgi:hypothetical protein
MRVLIALSLLLGLAAVSGSSMAAGARAPKGLPKASQAVKGAGAAPKIQVVDVGGPIKARRHVPAVTVDIARVPFRPVLREAGPLSRPALPAPKPVRAK